MRPTFHPHLVNGSAGDPALFVDCLFERRALLFDLGDILALPSRKLLRISHVFVSHAHMDHFIGFDWLLRILLGREKDLHLFGPPGFLAQVEHKLRAYTWNLVRNYLSDFILRVTEVDGNGAGRRTSFRCRNEFRREDEESIACPEYVAERTGYAGALHTARSRRDTLSGLCAAGTGARQCVEEPFAGTRPAGGRMAARIEAGSAAQ